MAFPVPKNLEPSELGTKEYWDTAYENELQNHESDATDTGQVWFSESDAERRVLAYLKKLAVDQQKSGALTLEYSATTYLDLGTGNGSMLRALLREGWKGEMLGVDYSEASICFARRISATMAGVPSESDGTQSGPEHPRLRAGADSKADLRYEVWDFMRGQASESIRPASGNGWDVVLDKGTFDAVSLDSQVDDGGRRIVETYRERVKPLVKRRTGLLVLTSCNWTDEELIQWLVSRGESEEADGGFEVFGKVNYPVFKFGGHVGQAISTVCFRRT